MQDGGATRTQVTPSGPAGPASRDQPPRDGVGQSEPQFDVTVWGYDRQQVDQTLQDLAARLADADRQLQSVRQLRAQLAQAQWEIERLRERAEHPPGWSHRLAEIMATAEQLRDQATRDAEEIRERAHAQARKAG